METKGPNPIHFSEMQRLMDTAYQRRQTRNGNRVEYRGWIIHHQYWRGGYVRLVNPVNRQIRLVPEVFIYEINGMKVYL